MELYDQTRNCIREEDLRMNSRCMSSRKHSQSLPGMVAQIERQIMPIKGGARVSLSISLSSPELNLSNLAFSNNKFYDTIGVMLHSSLNYG